MEMIKLQTTGAFMLQDPQSGFEYVQDEAREGPKTHFVIDRLELKQLKQVGKTAKDVVPSTEGEDRVDDGEPAVKDVDQQAGERAADSTQAETKDADGDGHDDKDGTFVEGNTAAAKPAARGKRGSK